MIPEGAGATPPDSPTAERFAEGRTLRRGGTGLLPDAKQDHGRIVFPTALIRLLDQVSPDGLQVPRTARDGPGYTSC